MKTIKTTFVVLFTAVLSISCNKSDDASTLVANDNFIRCKVDDVNFEITGNQIFKYKDASGFNIGFKNTVVTTGIDMAFYGVPMVQTYTCNPSNIKTVGRLQHRSPDIYSTAFFAGSSGIVTSTSVNGNTLQGTFSFSGKRLLMCTQAAKVVTDETFKITYS